MHILIKFSGSSTHHLLPLPATVRCCQRGGARLQVIWLASILSAAADRDSVDTVAVAIAGAVVTSLPSVSWWPNKDRAPPVPPLRLIVSSIQRRLIYLWYLHIDTEKKKTALEVNIQPQVRHRLKPAQPSRCFLSPSHFFSHCLSGVL